MGKKRTPTKLRLLMGNPGNKPIPQNEPEPPAEIPVPPDHLSAEATAEWNRICPKLDAVGILTAIDKSILGAYCSSYALWERAWYAINSMAKEGQLGTGLMIKTTNGNLIQNPLVGTANKAAADMIRYASELGMTPAARSRVKVPPGTKKRPEDKFFD